MKWQTRDKTVKITSSRINTLLTIGENLNIEFKRAGDASLVVLTETGRKHREILV